MSLQASDAEAAAVAIAPRVSLADIEAAIAERFDIGPDTLFTILGHASVETRNGKPASLAAVESLKVFSVCILVMTNGFTVIGKSAPASPQNFNAELGRKLAYEDCIRQLWPLMGFSLRDKLAAQTGHGAVHAQTKSPPPARRPAAGIAVVLKKISGAVAILRRPRSRRESR